MDFIIKVSDLYAFLLGSLLFFAYVFDFYFSKILFYIILLTGIVIICINIFMFISINKEIKKYEEREEREDLLDIGL